MPSPFEQEGLLPRAAPPAPPALLAACGSAPTPQLATRSAARARRVRQQRLGAAALVAVALLAAAASAGLLRGLTRRMVRIALYAWDPMLNGRTHARFPSPSCCAGGACPAPRAGRTALLTPLRSDNYLPLVQQLECTLRRSNPGVQLAVMVVPGELGAETLAWIDRNKLTRVEVAPLFYPNVFNPRYGSNWLKLQTFNLTQYDALVLVDSDAAVVGDLSPLFSLPTEFAASWDQPKLFGRWGPHLRGINSGVLLVRPCPAVLDHMLALLEAHPKLRFTYATAEQDFLDWYFRFTGTVLPVEYNTMASDSLDGNLTLGGRRPVVVHFTRNKPFHGPVPGKPGHQFLCGLHELS